MTGIFDSGRGGETALSEFRRLCPTEDVIFFADRENAPFGTKSTAELCEITDRALGRLISMGCERVLIACCTASTVHHLLPECKQRISIPIITPTAREAARLSASGRIAVLATDATVRSHAFEAALSGCEVIEIAAQALVGEIEAGARDGIITDRLSLYIKERLSGAVSFGADTVILGCTHFPLVEGEICRIAEELSGRKIITVSSARQGAIELLRSLSGEGRGKGRTVYV